MGGDAAVGGVCVDDDLLEQGADGFEVGITGPEEEGFCGVQEREAESPGRGEGVEFVDCGEEELDCNTRFLAGQWWSRISIGGRLL